MPEYAEEVVSSPEQKVVTKAWVTQGAVALCLIIFVVLVEQDHHESWAVLSKFGYLPADAVWNGGYWALITSTFVHFEIWHVAFNVYWLWRLGSCLERAIGPLLYFIFFILAAFVSSSFQLAASGDIGIGASGVGYSLFGFMWITRCRYPCFNEVLGKRTVNLFIIWLFVCAIIARLNILNIGNVAHISGLLFGVSVASAFVLKIKRHFVSIALFVMLLVISVIPLFWCPWSTLWLSNKAYSAHVAKQYDVALNRYIQIIDIDPKNAWAYINRSFVYRALGQTQNAEADLESALKIDPSIGNGQGILRQRR